MKLNVFVCVLILAALSLGAEQPRIALSDFTVEASSPKLQFMGKGIAELISVELLKSKDVVVVERERRAQLLEEMEFSLSDAADEAKVARIGKLLSADYLAFGKAVEMGDQFLFSMKLVDVETGEQRWADTLVESLGNYNRIAAYLTGSLLRSLMATVAASTEQKSEKKEEKSLEALIAFSQAVDSLDRKDTATAKQELQKARRMDPGNEAVVYYISKLSGASPRMQVELDLTAGSYNPALAAMLERPLIYFWQSMTRVWGEGGSTFGNINFNERFITGRIGLLLPLLGSIGLTAEVAPFTLLNSGLLSVDHAPLFTNYPGGQGNLDRSSMAALLGLSWRPLSALAFGASFRLGKYFQSEEGLFSDPWVGLHTDGAESTYRYGILPGQSFYSLTFEGGVVYRSADDNAGADLRVLYSPDTDGYLDTSRNELVSGVMPIVLSAGGSYGFLDRTLFLAGRVIAEAYYDDRSGVMLRTIPAVEWWPWEFIGLRAAYELAYLSLLGSTTSGHGGTAGVSVKLKRFSVDGNFTYRYRPYRHLPGYGDSEFFLLAGLSYQL